MKGRSIDPIDRSRPRFGSTIWVQSYVEIGSLSSKIVTGYNYISPRNLAHGSFTRPVTLFSESTISSPTSNESSLRHTNVRNFPLSIRLPFLLTTRVACNVSVARLHMMQYECMSSNDYRSPNISFLSPDIYILYFDGKNIRSRCGRSKAHIRHSCRRVMVPHMSRMVVRVPRYGPYLQLFHICNVKGKIIA